MNWTVNREVADMFPSPESATSADGALINSNWMSSLVRVEAGDDAYYVKHYTARGRGLRQFIGRSRVRAEWENLLFFASHDIPTAEVVAFGETDKGDYVGVLITKEVKETRDLATLVDQNHSVLKDHQWRLNVIDRLSCAVRKMHEQGFVHTDLKWRNILVETGGNPKVFIIDCPQGRKLFGPFLTRGRIKDLACLDKVARSQLSRTDRLRFYFRYKRTNHLSAELKQELRQILAFFKGRE